ncbi:uncharacterized protein T551_02138 [Pneumocystis jirovecii RU7]|uniref:LIM zinc-binding domain-containing protein n=1 Tax=Pneumocystis jirovecii (strain RU7) TaxID=1408657 RepID=A0A0W4ZMC1_PNEJ7|nr:uncharacterized protein T551_02138 [Pneumocystis jirovecii RU7]KTW29522.1 hypothetical protein T551_02138 [Pneumocystis jirovecii RU7]
MSWNNMYPLNHSEARASRDKFTVITQEIVNQEDNLYPEYGKNISKESMDMFKKTGKKLNRNNKGLDSKSRKLPFSKPLPVPDIMINERKPNKEVVIPPRPFPKNHKVNPDFLCETCHKDLGSGKVISVAEKKYHLDCFSCVHCMTNLEHVAFYEHENRLYCHLDYHELFSPRCKSCGTCIEDQAIFALENYYHPLHFFCAGCGEPFDADTPFIERDKYAWCQRCFENKYCSKCEKCKKPIVNDLVCAMDLEWHSKCFVCSICNSEFKDGFYIYNDDFNCQSCYSYIIKERT